MSRVWLGAVVLSGTVLVGGAAGSAGPAPWPTWSGAPTDVFRTGQYDRGEWIYTNGIRQARGANADGLERTQYYSAFHVPTTDPTRITDDLYNALTYDFFGSHRAAHNGDYQLPIDSARWPAGTAELAEVRLTVRSGALFVRFLWNSMPRPDAQIATLTFADANQTVGAPVAWPHNAKLSSRYRYALTTWGTGADLTDAVSTAGGAVPLAARVGDHTTEVRIPLALIGPGPWRLTGGSGLADPAHPSEYWTVPAGEASATQPGSGGPVSPTNVWGLLFADDSPWSFDELSQSRQLSAGTVTASEVVDPARLTFPYSDPAQIRRGDLSRLLHSKYGTKDGITQDTSGVVGVGPPPGFSPPIPNPGFNVSYYYTGALQDYAMHVPASYRPTTRTPLVVYLHGYTGLPEEPFHNPTGLVQAIDAKGWLLASALGRGDWFYRGGTPGEADVLEVIADVEKHYNVDRDRIYLMGHSMGGYGTNNVAMHHPDLFAAVAPAEGTDSADLHANLRNTPWLEMTAEEDLDTQAKNAKALYGSLSADGYDATLLDYQTKIHEYSSIYDTIPRLMAFFSSHVRQRDPAVVTWTRPVGQDNPKLGQRYDGAWWLRDVEPAPGVTRPTVTVERMGVPHATTDPALATRTDTMTDEHGPTMRSRAELFVTSPSKTAAPLQLGHLRVTASGARAASVRLAPGDFDRRDGTVRLTISSRTSVPLALRLLGQRGSAHRLVDGVDTGVIKADGRGLVVALPEGTHTVQLVVTAGSRQLTDRVGRPGLPTTGAPPGLLALASLMLIAGVSLRSASR